MIEWVPIKEFLRGANEFEHFLFINARNGCISKGSLINYNLSTLLASYTHAAKLNLPVEKTLENKVDDYLAEINVVTETRRDIVFNVIKIAKQHYEGEK